MNEKKIKYYTKWATCPDCSYVESENIHEKSYEDKDDWRCPKCYTVWRIQINP